MAEIISNKSQKRLPDFVVIGEMRCGSTTLWEHLEKNPNILFSAEKELHFFDNRDNRWNRGVEWYVDNFPPASAEQRLGEATPDYLFHPEARDRLAATLPHAKLIIILRDPTKRAWSHYWHNIRRGRETLSFEKALEAEPKRMDDPDPDIRSHFSYTRRGHYIDRIESFCEKFPREQIYVLFLENLIKDPEKETAAVLNFLEVSNAEERIFAAPPQRNTAQYPKWPVLNKRAQQIFRVCKKIPILCSLAQTIADRSRKMRTYEGSPRIPEEIRNTLIANYAESDEKLADFLDTEIPWRSKRSVATNKQSKQ